jgi:uncharacterized membrane protein YeaQ/YmgE (transglycosylase-associated protein family)
MGIIAFILLGVMAGLLTEAVYDRADAARTRRSLLLGVAGALAGGLVALAAGAGSIGDVVVAAAWAAALAGGLAANGLAALARARRPARA